MECEMCKCDGFLWNVVSTIATSALAIEVLYFTISIFPSFYHHTFTLCFGCVLYNTPTKCTHGNEYETLLRNKNDMH